MDRAGISLQDLFYISRGFGAAAGGLLLGSRAKESCDADGLPEA